MAFQPWWIPVTKDNICRELISFLFIYKGSTLIYFPKEIINILFRNIDNVQQDTLGQYILPCNASNLPNITLQINNNDFIITPHQYLIINGTVNFVYLL